jgi:hypothetical protein
LIEESYDIKEMVENLVRLQDVQVKALIANVENEVA